MTQRLPQTIERGMPLVIVSHADSDLAHGPATAPPGPTPTAAALAAGAGAGAAFKAPSNARYIQVGRFSGVAAGCGCGCAAYLAAIPHRPPRGPASFKQGTAWRPSVHSKSASSSRVSGTRGLDAPSAPSRTPIFPRLHRQAASAALAPCPPSRQHQPRDCMEFLRLNDDCSLFYGDIASGDKRPRHQPRSCACLHLCLRDCKSPCLTRPPCVSPAPLACHPHPLHHARPPGLSPAPLHPIRPPASRPPPCVQFAVNSAGPGLSIYAAPAPVRPAVPVSLARRGSRPLAAIGPPLVIRPSFLSGLSWFGLSWFCASPSKSPLISSSFVSPSKSPLISSSLARLCLTLLLRRHGAGGGGGGTGGAGRGRRRAQRAGRRADRDRQRGARGESPPAPAVALALLARAGKHVACDLRMLKSKSDTSKILATGSL